MDPNITFELFCKEDLSAFKDCITNTIIEIFDIKEELSFEKVRETLTKEILYTIYKKLPHPTKFDGLQWGFGDTEFREGVFHFCSVDIGYKEWVLQTYEIGLKK